jgi:SSS family solute:Na+ symporter
MGTGPTFHLDPIDLVLVGLYLMVALGHGLALSQRHADTEDYFLAGRRLTWAPIGLSLYASNMSGASFVGLMGASYVHGLSVFNYEWTAAVVLVVFAWVMLPRFWRAGIYTIPQFLELRLDVRSRRAYSAFTILAVLFIDTAGALYAGGLVLTTVFAVPLWMAVVLLAALAGVYTALGGLAAVVVTDSVQAVLLILGSVAILGFGWAEVGGWSGLVARTPPEQMQLILPVDDGFLPWPGILGVILLGFYYWTVNQFVVQRTLGARDLAAGQRGALFAGLLKLPNLALIVLPGIMAAQLYPGLDNPDVVFPHLAFELLPAGWRGLVVVALVAAILSSLDSALNAVATLVTMDFVAPLRPDWSQARLVRWGRGTTLVCIAISALYAPNIARFENLFGYFQSVLAYVTPPVVAVYLLATTWTRLSPRVVFPVVTSSFLLGVPLFMAVEIFRIPATMGWVQPHYTFFAVFMFGAAMATLVIGTWLFPRSSPPAPDPPLVPSPGLRGMSVGLLAAVAALILVFW